MAEDLNDPRTLHIANCLTDRGLRFSRNDRGRWHVSSADGSIQFIFASLDEIERICGIPAQDG